MNNMQKFRIGEELVLKWPILTNGEPVSLEGRNLRLVLHTPIYTDIDVDFSCEDNAAIFRITPGMQKALGVYSLSMFENFGRKNQGVVDYCHAFMLVATTCEKDNTAPGMCKEATRLDTSYLLIGYSGGAIIQRDNTGLFPNVGDPNVLYVDKSTDSLYRYDTTAHRYVCVSASGTNFDVINGGNAYGITKE